MISIAIVAGAWLLGTLSGFLLGRLWGIDREAEALDQIVKALDRHDWELQNPPADDREYIVIGDLQRGKPL